ncbi:ribose 5-phosphate isomerase B [Desulfoluna spongiiphila]|uniref:Ribose-5-phosphate isomerase n=1 Tax=Desulfoluna spongiiphila TaxID=419481 RepID=A0A1G5GR08_9BACT|nr:ribose 5-phosphate isomerase B [Desulfoluna spongiiphila]SCY53807.1 ribose-5-phosphate isomerase [Desulfoluna spongiiphila]VVS92844.1 ribose 5-phosphate isomerase b [Desulfoluna spongiiphila]
MSNDTTPYETEVIIGCDHAAYPLKETIKIFLESKGVKVVDAGCHGPESVNYPDFAKEVAGKVSDGTHPKGILLCGTGLGMSMAANRFKGVRAALVSDGFSARMSRMHNNSNILVMGARVIGESLALDLVRIWMETPFEGGRHLDRIQMFESF